MAYNTTPKIDSRGYEDILKEIALLAKEYTPEWKFSPDEPDAGTALACVFAKRTAETIEKLNRTPLNHRRSFYNMLGAAALPAVPASGYVQFRLNGICRDCVPVKEGFKLFSPVIDEQGTRLIFETTRDAWLAPVFVKETIYSDPARDLLCFWDEREKVFEPSIPNNSNKRSFGFAHELLSGITEACRLYMTIPGVDKERWAERSSDPELARFVRITDGSEEEIDCFNEKGRIHIAAPACEKIRAEIKDIGAFEGLSFGGINIAFEGRYIKPDNIFVNGELETEDTFYAFGESPAVYDSVCIECAAAFTKTGAAVTLAFDVDFETVPLGELPEPEIPNKLFVKKSDVRPIERKKITVDEAVWEYWNGTGFAALRGLEDYKNIFSGVDETGRAVRRSRYELKFVCPSDISPVLVGAAERLCVRARVKRMKNAFAVPSESFLPRMGNVRVSYKYDKPLAVTDMELVNNCEKTSVPRAFPFTRLPDKALYIGLDKPARNFTLLVCRDIPSNALDRADWSVLTGSGWESVKPQTSAELAGFFGFELDTPLTESSIFGRTAYWLKACISCDDFTLGKLLVNCVPVTQREEIESFCSDSVIERISLERKNILELQLCVNTAKKGGEENWEVLESGWTLDRAEGTLRFSPTLTLSPNSRTVKLKYRCGGGTAGNLPAEQEFVPSLTDGSICGAANPFPFSGGRDSEEPSRTECRLAGELRHMDRPITKRDLEEFLVGGDVISARVSADNDGGLDIEITAARGTNTEDIRNMVYAKLSDIMPVGAGGAKIVVIYENG